MSAVEDIDWLEPQTQAKDAINILVKAGDEPILVVENEKVLGLVQHSDIVKWLSLHQMTA